MDNNTLISIIFVSGTLIILLLRLIINRSMFTYKGDLNTRNEEFDSNKALLQNSLLTFLMFVTILIYDGCTNDIEQKYKIKYENVEKYLEAERAKGKEDALLEIRRVVSPSGK